MGKRWYFVTLRFEFEPEDTGMVIEAKDGAEAIEIAKEKMREMNEPGDQDQVLYVNYVVDTGVVRPEILMYPS